MSYEPPDFADFIGHELTSLISMTRVSDGIRLTTHCMYPSNGFVQVTVRGGATRITASDEGGAFGEAIAAGIPVADYHNKSLAGMVREQGLTLKDGVIFTPLVPLEAAAVAILHVANASQEMARWFYEHSKIKRARDFRLLLSDFLRVSFSDRVRPERIVGLSNKQHKFDNVLHLEAGRRLIIDSVANDASSINARVVANLDVKSIGDPLLEQRIVYDDEEIWTPADLNLLQVGAPAIPFSRSQEVIYRLAGVPNIFPTGSSGNQRQTH
jgi:hypothetical protein